MSEQPPTGEHPIERAHRFFRRAEAAAIELTEQVEDVVATMTAIEGVVVERAVDPDPAQTPPIAPRVRKRLRLHPVELAIIVAAIIFGALMLQRSTRT